MSAKAKSKLTPEQQKATMTRVLQKIKPYGFFVVCSLIVPFWRRARILCRFYGDAARTEFVRKNCEFSLTI